MQKPIGAQEGRPPCTWMVEGSFLEVEDTPSTLRGDQTGVDQHLHNRAQEEPSSVVGVVRMQVQRSQRQA